MKTLFVAAAIAATGVSAWLPASAASGAAKPETFARYEGLGYSVLVPAGWVRTRRGSTMTFSANGNSESIDIAPAKPLDVRKDLGVKTTLYMDTNVGLDRAPAALLRYRSLSKPDPVTRTSVAFDNTVYLAIHRGRRAILHMSAPAGADNADRWNTIAESFHWQ